MKCYRKSTFVGGLIYDILYKKKKPKSKNYQSQLFKTLTESCGFYCCTGKMLVLLWPLIDLFKKNWEPQSYSKIDYLIFWELWLQIQTTNFMITVEGVFLFLITTQHRFNLLESNRLSG
jgi:hypothetical protein